MALEEYIPIHLESNGNGKTPNEVFPIDHSKYASKYVYTELADDRQRTTARFLSSPIKFSCPSVGAICLSVRLLYKTHRRADWNGWKNVPSSRSMRTCSRDVDV